MKNLLTYILCITCLSLGLSAQDSTENTGVLVVEEVDSVSKQEEEKRYVNVSMCFGRYALIGDNVSNTGFDILSSNPSFTLEGFTLLRDDIYLEFSSTFGSIIQNPSTVENFHTSFKTSITSFGLALRYVHRFKTISYALPYVSLGLSMTHFSSYADLRDANGVLYNYWSDGRIMSLPEDHEFAFQSTELVRDYSYETDMRDIYAGSYYSRRALSLPLGLGVRFLIMHHLSINLGTVVTFNFTDVIDNINPNNIALQDRGNALPDILTNTYLGFSFHLKPRIPFKSKWLKHPERNDVYFVIDDEDTDADKHPNIYDDCHNTPKGLKTEDEGCAIDRDNDLIPDYADEEPETKNNRFVNEYGVQLTRENIKHAFERSKGKHHKIKDTTHSVIEIIGDDLPNKGNKTQTFAIGKNKDVYSVVLKYDIINKLSEDRMANLLSISNLSITDIDGVNFLISGEFENIEEAIKHEARLKKAGFKSSALARQRGEKMQLVDVELDEDRYATFDEELSSEQRANKDNISYRVQVGAFSKEVDIKFFSGLGKIIKIRGEDGYSRVYSGSFKTLKDAAKFRVKLLEKGFVGSFVVAFRDGKRISLEEAGAVLADKKWKENISTTAVDVLDGIDEVLLKDKTAVFRLVIGLYKTRIPKVAFNKMLEIGNVDVRKDKKTGISYYSIGKFKSVEEAKKARRKLQKSHFTNISIFVEKGGEYVPIKE